MPQDSITEEKKQHPGEQSAGWKSNMEQSRNSQPEVIPKQRHGPGLLEIMEETLNFPLEWIHKTYFT